MGARVYLPTAGRFLQVDPIEGGTHNAYVYVADPVNWHDYSGLCAYIIQCTATIEYFQPAAPVQTVQPASASSVLRSATSRRLTTTTSRAPSVGISIGYVAGGLSIAVDVASDAAAGVGRQSSVFGSKLRQGSSVAGKYLPTVSQLAKNPVIDVVGRVGGPMAAGVEFVGNYFEGDSLGRNALKTGGGVAGGVIGAGVGGAACGVITFGTGGLAGVTCPVLMGGLGAAGSWLGNKAGETLSNLFGW